jgi:hypothetical protein
VLCGPALGTCRLARRYSLLWVVWNLAGLWGAALRLRELRRLRRRWEGRGGSCPAVGAALQRARRAAAMQATRHALYTLNAVRPAPV